MRLSWKRKLSPSLVQVAFVLCLVCSSELAWAENTKPVTQKMTTSKSATTSALGLRHPAFSPDATQVAFGYQGDIWVVAREGGVARRVTTHPAYDMRPRWSPDGRWLLFTSKRTGQLDVFVIPAMGGQARRLTYHSASDTGCDWSADGRRVLFQSNRENTTTLYEVPVSGGTPRRVVGGFWNIAHSGAWGPKSRYLLMNISFDGLFFWWRKGYIGPNNDDVFLFDTKTQRGKRLTRHLRNDIWPMWGPQGKTLFFVSERGIAPQRKSLPNIWRAQLDTKSMRLRRLRPVTRFTKDPVRWPSLSRNGKALVYERHFQLWTTDLVSGKSSRISVRFHTSDHATATDWKTMKKVSEFALSPDGKKLAFVMFGDVYVTDSRARTSIRRLTQSVWREHHVTWAADSLHVVYVSDRGQGDVLFRRSALSDGKEEVLARSKEAIFSPRFSPNGKHLVYFEGKDRVMWLKLGAVKAKASKRKQKKAKQSQAAKSTKAAKAANHQPVLLVKAQIGGFMAEAVRWSPDSHWVLYTTYDRTRGELWMKSLDDKAPRRLTHSAAHDSEATISRDGKYLIYRSNRYGSGWFTRVGDDDLYIVSLQHKKPSFREDNLDKLFKKPKSRKAKASKASQKKAKARKQPKPRTRPLELPKKGEGKPKRQRLAPLRRTPTARPKTKPKTDPAPSRRRTKTLTKSQPSTKSRPTPRTLTKKKKSKKKKCKKVRSVEHRDLRYRHRALSRMKGDERWPMLAPKGHKLVFLSNALGRYHLWVGTFRKGKLRGAKRIAPTVAFNSAWSAHGMTWGPKGKSLYLLQRGQIVRVSVPSGATQRLRLKYDIQINRSALHRQMFREVWRAQHEYFYDAKMHGADWQEVYQRYLPVVTRIQHPEDWRDLMNEMLGELNASHLGVRLPRSRTKARHTGVLGAELRMNAKGQLVIAKILHRGPLYEVARDLKTGSVIQQIDGQPVSKGTNVYRLLRGKIGRRVTLTVLTPKASKVKMIKVKPTSYRRGRGLRYLAWVKSREALVRQWSKGKVGYLHIEGMGKSQLYKFIRDFETDVSGKPAGIIDVRFNWGGNIHDRVLQILSRRRYSRWQPRGLKAWSQPSFPAPQPMTLLINERSLSDAEMMANGFKALKLGKIVGVGTYRWIIFTTGLGLINGGMYRLPFWSCFGLKGNDLERTGVAPDIKVRNSFMDRLRGRDPQLKRAVRELLRRRR